MIYLVDNVIHLSTTRTWGLFLKSPEKFPHLESHGKISNLMITQLLYSHTGIPNVNWGSLHTKSFRFIHLSVFRYRLSKNGLAGLKSFWGFWEPGLWFLTFNFQSHWEPGPKPVVQKLDNAIRRINRYPLDKFSQNKPRYLLDSDLSGG